LAFPSPGKIDLHVHSNHSDGLKSVGEIVRIASERGLQAIAITDHDVLSGLEEAQAAGLFYHMEIVPGIEISSSCDGYETHLLGYFIDPNYPPLLNFTQKFRTHRLERARQILGKLTHHGINIPFDLLQMRAGHSSIGRPHIADILVEEGYVFSFQEAFNKYLAQHRPAFVPKIHVEAERAIYLIHEAGGLAFLAHPAVNVPDEVIYKMVHFGLDGLETLHPKHHVAQIQYYQEMARKWNLAETGGSDCHGARQGEMMLGCMMVPYSYLDRIKARLAATTPVIPFSETIL
jgi:3',5'-nucleoside bisphosphate phosphatase